MSMMLSRRFHDGESEKWPISVSIFRFPSPDIRKPRFSFSFPGLPEPIFFGIPFPYSLQIFVFNIQSISSLLFKLFAMQKESLTVYGIVMLSNSRA